jgi:hypothetical protein
LRAAPPIPGRSSTWFPTPRTAELRP